MTDSLKKNGPSQSIYCCSKTGWSNEDLFYEWLQHFTSTVKPSKVDPVLLLLDNHSSHISLPIFDFCKEQGICLLTLPPHTSHKVQPLDISFFGPLKSAFNRQCDSYLLTAEKITQYDLAQIFAKAYVHSATMEKAQSGFRTSGIWPFQPDKFTDDDFLPATFHLPVVIDDEPLPSTSAIDNKENQDNNEASVSGSSILDKLSPLPQQPRVKKSQRKKQKSAILTETPNREKLEVATEKRKERANRLKKCHNNKKTEAKTSKVNKGPKRKVFEDSDSECLSESDLCDDDELDDMESSENDMCLVCGDGVKKNEIWYQCPICQRWAHALCTGEDSPEGYVCDLCDK